MVCANCGKNLIRGYAFCLECGSPVPPEVLEEGGMPGRTDDEGKPKPESENAEKNPENADNSRNTETPVYEVSSSMPGIGSSDSGSDETLVFCPNCGMHMQSDPYRCNKCGMTLGKKPKNVPYSAGGVPLMNVDPTGGLGSIGGLDGISESDIEQITGFMSGTGNIPIFAAEDNSTPDLFGSDISANDFAALSEQLANFSAANGIASIDTIDDAERGQSLVSDNSHVDRRVDNFNMGDVLPTDISDNAVPVIDNYSMDEIPDENIDLNPYKFLGNSMEDIPETQSSMPQAVQPARVPVKEPETKPEQPAYEPNFSQSKPAPQSAQTVQAVQTVQTPKVPEPLVFPETAPVIEESAPVVSEYIPEQPAPQPFTPNTAENGGAFGSEDIFNKPVPKQNTAPQGNLFRCQFCGQSMYDTDKFCPNCGASYKNGTASPPKKKSKAPLFIGIAAALIVIAAGGYFAMNFLNNGNGGESLPLASGSAVTSDSSELTESTQTEEDNLESSSTTLSTSSSSTSSSTSTKSSTTNSSTGAPAGSSSSSSTGGAPSSSR